MKLSIDQIKENPDNPRYIRDERFKKLVKSIQDFPQMLDKRPLVLDENMVVLGGNMRLRACREAGLKEVPVLIADDWTEAQKKEFIIKDNIGYGEWDYEVLANEWDTELLSDWGLEVPDVGVSLDDQDDEEPEPKEVCPHCGK